MLLAGKVIFQNLLLCVCMCYAYGEQNKMCRSCLSCMKAIAIYLMLIKTYILFGHTPYIFLWIPSLPRRQPRWAALAIPRARPTGEWRIRCTRCAASVSQLHRIARRRLCRLERIKRSYCPSLSSKTMRLSP